ncbi:MAG: preprotein translocase subunit SecA [Candidatus Magasanikbacteria bacterium RIFCSPHIGHO2_01_FULL_33_34]|uniref:Protein translocase subunit SecA n=1 Tax=Candidatus Magasanikbacteria bacterium RIFCSPHIGHO2_01_FULL_33_34 TaxID=1798671 RepID=A0A1F6LHM7_9BACT|nr:MAG: preprotein translocase subunit SecA [Candidatus Magasanikbacteria bacterium RIFCSPHIGHO2_01_FULL_33_34]OGH65077.1 MAG: preprotein translocase subunit SecA [Candidatus Magasanikbacteria bacterium RIFCSPHIGHO2_02_FULL_33_17]OGH75379.1 MAG: preprotein translocase subunit SecA [Candidatus Magasanikbacteria bacterium RIFCSPLOWO2_01_FULL_33_34]
MSFLTKLLIGDPNAKVLKSLQTNVDKINSLESEYEKLSDDKLKSKTLEFKKRLEAGETLDDILVEAFATVREVSKRTTGMRHYDVQLVGGMVLHSGKIAEMRTGEGKTLVATLPIYLNALAGKGVHLITVNDYLAKRDAVWMSQIYDFLGLSVGIIQNQRVSYIYDSSILGNNIEGSDIDQERDESGSYKVEEVFLRPSSRQEAYRCDITYGTNNEFGFDYLRDNMVQKLDEMVMRPGSEMTYAIIDEVDSILIDEARTPLIISAPAEKAADQYYQFAKLVRNLKENEDYNIDEKLRAATLTEEGVNKFESWLGVENIYVESGMRTIHHIEQSLKAEVLFKRDKEYVVEGNNIVIIDEFTGRKMPGRRYSEGLHQAIEAKEGVEIQRESQTLATVTFQNLFRMYGKLSGMTGTAITEAEEFGSIYNLEVVTIPTNRTDVRIDRPDRIYKNEKGKNKAVLEKIKECQAKNQPILVGTISVEKNEELSAYLDLQGIKYEALNAKNHEREGEIVAQAGRPGAVTLATNMAGRGVDIKLGGAEMDETMAKQVREAGGLFVLGTERHESRRIDNQLRGRSARQGDPGETQFFVSTDDDLMRIFAGDRLKAVMTKLNVPDDMPIEQKMITKMIETAQKKVEGHNFDIRKHLLEYDDVLNKQRTIIYKKRKEILESANEKDRKKIKELVLTLIEQEIEFIVSYHTNFDDKKEWNVQEIYETAKTIFNFTDKEKEELLRMNKFNDNKLDEIKTREMMVKFLLDKSNIEYENLENSIMQSVGDENNNKDEVMKDIEKSILLRAIDTLWVEHLVSIDHLRTGIGLRGYGQRDPLIEYKKETYDMFNELQSAIQKEVVYSFFKIGAGLQLAPTIMASDKMTLQGAKKSSTVNLNSGSSKPRDGEGKKVGRNDMCPCGSGKKYKKCHGV